MKAIFSAVFAILLVFSSTAFAGNTEPSTKAAAVTKAAVVQEAININTADAQTLIKLKGIGAKKAEAIVAWRKANGSFKSIEQLADVKGIGAATVEANRKLMRI